MEKPSEQFSTPEEEIAFLREQIAAQERELIGRNLEADHTDFETVGKQELREYVTFTPQSVLKKEHQPNPEDEMTSLTRIEDAKDKVSEVLDIALEKGVHHALTMLEKQKDAFLTDEVHRRLVEAIKTGREVEGLKEGVPPWQVLHMTLFEVTLPRLKDENGEKSLQELAGMMQQFYAGMRSIGRISKAHYVMELAVAEGSSDIIMYVAVPNEHIDLFEKQILSLFPNAMLTLRMHDYNIFVDGGTSAASIGTLKKHPIYPIRQAEDFQTDPFMVLINAFSKIEKEGGGAAVQIVINPDEHLYAKSYEKIIERVEGGMSVRDSIAKSSLGGEMMLTMREVFAQKKKTGEPEKPVEVDVHAVELFQKKVQYPVIDTNIRLVVSARDETRAKQILAELESTFNQYKHVTGNNFEFKRQTGKALAQTEREFSFRQYDKKQAMPVSEMELSTFFHFPASGVGSSPQFKQSYAKTAAAPTEMPSSGTFLGTNSHRGYEQPVYVTEADRMRHFYIIGQTGTGKSVFMKNMLMQDIQAGAGVCMIDPHGTDIEDVLAAVPPEREQDVIYFDPSQMERVIGLNMLEYDPAKPEQKTFVVNELFSIFQKLYGANPESMGPMFEQYFRNATLLVMEHPESGNTLMDISRVMSDASYRRMKLQHATNPVVTQFWREIAGKAGGEAALENIVPYIVSKFDVFTANDYLRPIIGQQESTFNFRKLMDERKILLVNLSKGRLGDINANLIGMIVVGKLLMAALSRVDTPSAELAPFFLHIDEFQNVSTPSISAILSEARKYKLGLVMAHQFIAQLDEKISDAVFGNVGSMAVFRVGPEDAQFLEHQLGTVFAANEIMNIPNYQAYMRILANGVPTQPFSMNAAAPPEVDTTRVPALIAASLERYGRPRDEIEAEIQARYQKPKPPVPSTPPQRMPPA